MTWRTRETPADGTASEPSTLVAVAGGAIALAMAVGIGRFVYTPILPLMMAALGLSKSTAGIIASANFFGYLAGAVIAAHPRLPGSRRFWLMAGLAGSALTTIAMGFFQTTGVFLVLRFLGGMASAFALIFTSALLLDVMARRARSGLSAVLFAGVGIGITISAVLISALARAGSDWSTLWLVSGLLSAAGGGIAALMLPGDGPAPANRHPTDPRGVGRKMLCLVLAYGLFGFGYIITATFLVALVRDDPGVRGLERVVWVVFGLAAIPSVALWDRLAGRLGIPRAFALAAVVEAAGVVASSIWQTNAGVLAASLCVGGTFMGLTALGLMRGKELARGDARRVLALMTVAFGIGQIVGPAFAGFAFEYLQSFMVPSLTAASALIVAAALVLQ